MLSGCWGQAQPQLLVHVPSPSQPQPPHLRVSLEAKDDDLGGIAGPLTHSQVQVTIDLLILEEPHLPDLSGTFVSVQGQSGQRCPGAHPRARWAGMEAGRSTPLVVSQARESQAASSLHPSAFLRTGWGDSPQMGERERLDPGLDVAQEALSQQKGLGQMHWFPGPSTPLSSCVNWGNSTPHTWSRDGVGGVKVRAKASVATHLVITKLMDPTWLEL